MTDCGSLRDRYFGASAAGPMSPELADHLRTCTDCRVAYAGLPFVDQLLLDVAGLPVSTPSFDTIALAAAGAARQQQRRQKLRRSYPFLYTGVAAAAVAAAIVVAVTMAGNRSRAPVLLLPGSELKSTAEAKSAVLPSGARLRLEAGTVTLAATPKQETLLLSVGNVFLDVPKLVQGAVVTVRTPDAEVRVHGTRFEVTRTANSTQVEVAEGLVEVRPEGIGRPVQFLHGGESTTVTSAEAHREALRLSTLDALDRGNFAAAEKQIDSLFGESADGAQRAEAQALQAWSIAARGKPAEAIELYRRALVLLPEGSQPLWAENACAELAMLVERQTPKNAPEIWADCLRRFPNGVHTDLVRPRARSNKGF